MYKVINWKQAANKCNGEIEFLNLTCTPHEEICTQAGQEPDQQISECTALINQLIREQGPAPEGAQFFIVENTGHDFGVYYEAGIFYTQIPEPSQYDIDNETELWQNWWNAEQDETTSEIYALSLESNIPDNWDAEALKELREAGHPNYQPAKVVKMKVA